MKHDTLLYVCTLSSVQANMYARECMCLHMQPMCAFVANLQVVPGAAGMALQVEAVEEEGDGAVLRGLEDDGAVYVVGVHVWPAWALQVAVGLLIGPTAT